MRLIMKDFEVVGMDEAKKILLIRSTKPKKEFKRGGSMHGHQYQFGINANTFKYCGISLMEMTGMTEKEHKNWKKQYESNE